MIKVLQYNIYFGENDDNINIINNNDRLSNICICILSVDADVVCLQEVLQSKYELIKNYLNEKYPHRFAETIDKKYGKPAVLPEDLPELNPSEEQDAKAGHNEHPRTQRVHRTAFFNGRAAQMDPENRQP